jgi:hypothetical protein
MIPVGSATKPMPIEAIMPLNILPKAVTGYTSP